MAASDDRIDAAMLESMATAFRSGMWRRFGFSFNDQDMAELLDRCAARAKPRLQSVTQRMER